MFSRHKRMLGIAIPQVLGNLLHILIIYTDFFMVSKLSAEAIVAVGVGLQIWGLFYATTVIIFSGQNTLINRFMGAGEIKKASMLISSLLIFVIFLSIPMIVFWQFFGIYLFKLFGANTEIVLLGEGYLSVLCLAIAFVYINGIFFTAFVADGDSKTPMYIRFGMVFLNVLLDYMFIFGHFGFEPMGVKGAAIATLIALGLETFIYILLFLQKRTSYHVILHFSTRLIKRTLRISYPAMIDSLIGTGSMFLFSAMILAIGTTVSAGFQLGLRIEGLAVTSGFGFAMAASVLMGQNLGAKKPDESYRYVMLSLKYTVIIMFTISLLFIFYPKYLITFFTQDKDIIKEASYYLLVVGIIQIPLAISFVLSAALRGAGDTKRVFRINIITTWIFRLLPGLISVYGFNSIIGVYIGMFMDPIVKSAIYWIVFKKGEWRTLKV